MKQVIKEVLQAEEKAAAVLTQARAQASEIKLAAEKEASEQISEAKGQVRAVMQGIIEEGKKAAERTREERLAQADRDNEALMTSRAETIKGLVDDICRVIIATDREDDRG